MAFEELFERLGRSAFRSRFHLKEKEMTYLFEKGWDVIEIHAADFVKKRLAPGVIKNDGRQTPMKGHPVFVAQHATACCCRGCLRKWHNILENRPLTFEEEEYVRAVIMEWLHREAERSGISAIKNDLTLF